MFPVAVGADTPGQFLIAPHAGGRIRALEGVILVPVGQVVDAPIPADHLVEPRYAPSSSAIRVLKILKVDAAGNRRSARASLCT